MNQREIKSDAKHLIECAFDALLGEEWHGNDSDYAPGYLEEGSECRSICMGTVFTIMPSGKYYMPWARSNVEPCPRCKGWEVVPLKGYLEVCVVCKYCDGMGSREAFEDVVMGEWLEHYADKVGCSVEEGEGDPCDIFLSQVREKEVIDVDNSKAVD